MALVAYLKAKLLFTGAVAFIVTQFYFYPSVVNALLSIFNCKGRLMRTCVPENVQMHAWVCVRVCARA